ncbi:NAD-P-binding protein [Panaeolus papilionaceus]|nr:NAD-P-binding protein [Panaeolus papilionaceus]
MRFLILGSTGPSGVALTRKTQEVYPDSTIVLYVRSPEKIPEDLRNSANITITKGTLEDLDSFMPALEGVDTILSALGPLGPTAKGSATNQPITTFYGHLIDFMHQRGIKRFICLATASVTDTNDKHSLKYSAIVTAVKVGANYAYKEIVGMGEVVRTKGKDLEWTIVRVPFLTNGDSEEYVAGYIGDGKVGVTLSRKAYAAFVVEEVGKRAWVQAAPMLSSA